jgi:hypothetical protein
VERPPSERFVVTASAVIGVAILTLGGLLVLSDDDVPMGNRTSWTLGVLVTLGIFALGYVTGRHLLRDRDEIRDPAADRRFATWTEAAAMGLTATTAFVAAGSRFIFGIGNADGLPLLGGLMLVTGAAWLVHFLARRSRRNTTAS